MLSCGGNWGHARQEQSARDAAMIYPVYDFAQRDTLARELAVAFLASQWTAEAVAEAGAGCLDRWPSWISALAMSVVAVHRTPPVDRREDLVQLIVGFLESHVDTTSAGEPPRVLRLQAPPRHLPSPELARQHGWPVAAIPSVPALAERLELSDGQLAWLADVRGLERSVSSEQLRNYRYRARPRDGGVPRLIEAPKARLKEVQRWLLREILDHVPVHEAAHGFTHHRSAVTHAALHTGQPAVLRLDLKDFFASVSAGRVYGLWRSLGYSPSVSHVLTGLSTNVIPAGVWSQVAEQTPGHAVQARFWLGRQLATPHLPQGAPTSPTLANLIAYGLDRRLSGLARASGLRYSRYADDLTFSGGERLHRRRPHFESVVAEIVRSEGFRLNEAKSAIQSDGGRQIVCGVVVNLHTNLRRTEYDRLKAILHNAAKQGPLDQNREGVRDFRAHLLGRISWVEALNPGRGRRLRELYATIAWPEPPTLERGTDARS
jgi:RNA-directed DNA polymerase